MKKNYALDFLKVIFMIFIIVHHFTRLNDYLVRGHIAVEFFFITSGFLLYNTYKSHKERTTLIYLKNRIVKLYPCYIAAFIAQSLWLIAVLKQIPYKNIFDGILEALMLSTTPFYNGSAINQPIWYISVLLTGGVLIYALLRKIPKIIINISSIIIIVAVYITLVFNGNVENWNTELIFVMPWWRGLADLFIGVLIAQIVENSSEKVKENNIWVLLEAVCFVGTIATMFVKLPYFDFVSLIFIIGLVISATMKSVILNKIGNTKVVRFLAKYEYPAYVSHILVISLVNLVCRTLGLPLAVNLIALLAGVLAYSIIFKFFVDKGVSLITAGVKKITKK